MDTNQVSQTDWNGGTLTNLRIHTIRDEIKVCASVLNLSMWLSLLEQMNHEVYGFETEEEKKDIREQLKKLSDIINKYNTMKNNPMERNKGIPYHIIDSLNDMQYKLDEVFHKSGLQTALREDAGDAF